MRDDVNLYIKYALVIILTILCYLVLKPYLSVIILALIIAYMCLPVKRYLGKRINNKNAVAAIITILVLLIIIIPLYLLTNSLIQEVAHLYTTTNVDDIKDFFNEKLNVEISETLQVYINDIAKTATSFILTKLSEFLFSIPELIVNFFIMFFVFFFAIRDGENTIQKAKQLLPLEDHHKNRFEKKIRLSIESLFYGTMALAAIETITAVIGFYFLGIETPILWGFVVGLTAILPGIGATIVWGPMALFAYLQANTLQALFIAIFGFFILSTLIDTILRARILGMRTETHPLVILIGVLGGLSAFGFIGLFIGPLILSILDLVLEIYLEKKNET